MSERMRTPIAPFIRRFLLEHLVQERNLSHNTQTGYRDTLLLLLPFVAKAVKVSLDQLDIEDFTPDRIRAFLKYLQTDRHVSDATRNQRLVAIHSLARFIGENSPEHLAWCTPIRGIAFKRTPRRSVPYLDKSEVDAVLAVPDRRTPQGARDHALLLFLFNSGARASEAAHLTIGDLISGRAPLPAARRFYEKKATQRNPILAMKALSHKLARACYYVMRDRISFDPARLFG